MDVVTLSRMQFALNIAFHYLFPPLSIGLGIMLIIMEGAYLRTKNPVYERMTHFWVKIFALIFAVGVATGLVQVFAFGTNWANFSRFVGDVFGSMLGAEGIFAFFLESGFLAILLFGWKRVGPKMHFFSTIMVALGAHFSGIWIVAANSWMQTPAGYEIVGEGAARHAIMKSWWEVVNNPSTLDRLAHVLIAAWMTGAFLVISVSAYYLLKKRHIDFATKSFKIGMTVATITILLQLWSGDSTGRGVAINQPIKLAAFEGVYKTVTPTTMWAAGYVDAKTEKIVGIPIPGLLSFLVYRDFTQAVPGLDQFPRELWPNVKIVFQTYHGMITMWGVMFIAVIFGLIAWKRKKLLESRWTLRFLVISVLFPEIGNQLGWYSAEIGRQPWVVYNLLRTKDAVSQNLVRGQVIFSLIMFAVIYTLFFIMFIFLMNRKIQQGPQDEGLDEYRDPYKK
ncbi:MAG: Cytochrome bd-II ubiquinol oxidase subunit 1 [Chlamydiales bacterium]|nr:Cytochrome bd-II ubiquinol oxidase subunit 1 [Chlamydiales bacterium]